MLWLFKGERVQEGTQESILGDKKEKNGANQAKELKRKNKEENLHLHRGIHSCFLENYVLSKEI